MCMSFIVLTYNLHVKNQLHLLSTKCGHFAECRYLLCTDKYSKSICCLSIHKYLFLYFPGTYDKTFLIHILIKKIYNLLRVGSESTESLLSLLRVC